MKTLITQPLMIAQPVAVPCLSPEYQGGMRTALKTRAPYIVTYQRATGETVTHRVPDGYEFDASIPALMVIRRFIGSPYNPEFWAAAAVHDFYYQTHLVSREEADRVFEELLYLSGVPDWKRAAMVAAVRAFGWAHYPISFEDYEYTKLIQNRLIETGDTLANYQPVYA